MEYSRHDTRLSLGMNYMQNEWILKQTLMSRYDKQLSFVYIEKSFSRTVINDKCQRFWML